MAFITLDQARAHLRVEADYPAIQIESYIAGAEDAAAAYLNRKVFQDAQALEAALSALPAVMTAARVSYEAAVTAAGAIENAQDRCDALEIARTTRDRARADARTTLNGILANPSILAASLLILGHLFENREDVVAGATAQELPNGARSLLRPYRLVMMP